MQVEVVKNGKKETLGDHLGEIDSRIESLERRVASLEKGECWLCQDHEKKDAPAVHKMKGVCYADDCPACKEESDERR